MAISSPESKIDFLVENGKIIYPVTLLEGIYALDGSSLKNALEAMNRVLAAKFTVGGWVEDGNGFSQTVAVEGMKEAYSPILVKVPLGGDTTADDVKAYDKAFAILASPIDATTADGSVTFKVTKKPATDITVGLKGV